MHTPLPDSALDQIFRDARSLHAFTAQPVTDQTLKALYDLLKWGPTAFNSQPARYVFLRSKEAKARLAPALMASNLDKTLAAPVTVIVAQNLDFAAHLPVQFPAYDAKPLFDANAVLTEVTAFRNSTLQGAYLILAARAGSVRRADVGLRCGETRCRILSRWPRAQQFHCQSRLW